MNIAIVAVASWLAANVLFVWAVVRIVEGPPR